MSTQYIRLSQNIRNLERIIAALRLNTRKDRYNRGLIAGVELALDVFSGKTSTTFQLPKVEESLKQDGNEINQSLEVSARIERIKSR